MEWIVGWGGMSEMRWVLEDKSIELELGLGKWIAVSVR